MKRLLVFFCTALLLLSACAMPPPAATPMPVESPKTPEPPIKTPAPTRTPEPAVPPELAVSEALVQEVYLRLCAPEFEGRFAGSDANARAGEYLAGLLSEYGYAPLLGDSMLVPYSAPLGDPGMLGATAELHFRMAACVPLQSVRIMPFASRGRMFRLRFPSRLTLQQRRTAAPSC